MHACVRMRSSQGGASGKEPACRRRKRCGFDPWVRKIPWRRTQQPTPAFLPGESHRQRSLADYSAWGHKESGMTEQPSMGTTHPPSCGDPCRIADNNVRCQGQSVPGTSPNWAGSSLKISFKCAK